MNKLLIELGSVSSLDVTKLSESTLISMASHIRTLQRNGVELDLESLTFNTVEMLDRLRDTKGKPLNSAYKRQIAMTIKRLHPEISINIGPFSRHQQNSTTRLMSGEFVKVIGEMVERAARVVRSVYFDHIKDLAVYDTCLMILLTIATGLRAQEIHDLKMSHIDLIRSDRPVPIRTKGYQNLRTVPLNATLDNLFIAIEQQRDKVKGCVDSETRNGDKHRFRFNANYIVITSIDFMRKKLRELASGVPDLDSEQSFGFNVFRKYITTVLIENGGYKIAQDLNNHSSGSTTMNHYNVVSKTGAQKTYDKLFRMIDELERKPEIEEDEEMKMAANRNTTTNDYTFPETPAYQATDITMK